MAKKEKEQVVFDEAVHGQALRDMIKEASGNKLKAESYLELNKDIKDRAKKELGVEGKLFNQLLARPRETCISLHDWNLIAGAWALIFTLTGNPAI